MAARDQCDKHVCKMLVESVQMLCTHLIVTGTSRDVVPYRPTHANHPCTRWLRESDANVAWLRVHTDEQCHEYTRRYGRVHKSDTAFRGIEHLLPPEALAGQHTPFALAMPEEFHGPDAVIAYRAFYIVEKSHFAVWKDPDTRPDWWRDPP